MFPYDEKILAAIRPLPTTIPEVLGAMQSIQAICADEDGLKWFNWLYSAVTQTIESRVAEGGFSDPAWLSQLDVQFAALYFNALASALTGGSCPGCWGAMFAVRNQARIARIQFALAGMNAHINHDLPLAVMATSKAAGTIPRHGTPQYNDYTGVNANLDSLIETAKETLNVRLPGDALPPVTHLEAAIAAWNLGAARESAWNTAEALWGEPPAPQAAHMDVIDGLTTVISKSLLVPVP